MSELKDYPLENYTTILNEELSDVRFVLGLNVEDVMISGCVLLNCDLKALEGVMQAVLVNCILTNCILPDLGENLLTSLLQDCDMPYPVGDTNTIAAPDHAETDRGQG